MSLVLRNNCRLLASLLRVEVGTYDFAVGSSGNKKNCNPAKSHFCVGKKGTGGCVSLTKKCAMPATGAALGAAMAIDAQKPKSKSAGSSQNNAQAESPKSKPTLDPGWQELAQFGINPPDTSKTKLLDTKPEGSHDSIPKSKADQDQHFEKFTTSKISAQDLSEGIENFTTSEYDNMRTVERGGAVDPEDLVLLDSAGLQHQVAALNHYMKNAPKFKGGVHRGLSFGDQAKFTDFMQKLTQDSGFEVDAMSSFSSEKKAAQDFDGGKYGIMLNVKANQSGTSIKNASWHNEESEVLVPKGTKYRISGPPRISISNMGHSLFEFDIEEIK